MSDLAFSQRYGYQEPRSALQKESIDQALRNSLWNVLLDVFGSAQRLSGWEGVMAEIWRDYFKAQVDTVPYTFDGALSQVKKYFFSVQWFQVYDFVEFIAPVSRRYLLGSIADPLNLVLKREGAAYRLVKDKIVEIVSEEEIQSIEQAATRAAPPAQTHLRAALALLSDRVTPDYRNSVKESISAVEATCKQIAGDDQADLAKALRQIETPVPLHPALRTAFEKLYGYTSDAEGIRHALMVQPSLAYEDALFMLICCSAFINFLTAKVESSKSKA